MTGIGMTSPGAPPACAPAAPPPALTAAVYARFEDAEALAAEWDALAERRGDVYATFDWCRAWWSFYGSRRRLKIVAVRQGRALVAVFPLFVEKRLLGGLPARLVRPVGCDSSVTTCGVLIEEGHETEACAGLGNALSGERWDCLLLAPLAGYASGARALSDALGAAMPDAEVSFDADRGPHTVFDLPETFDAYLDSLSKRERANILYEERHMRRGCEVAVRVVDDLCGLPDAFDRFVALHQANWRSRGRLGHFGDWPRSLRFHEELLGRLGPRGRVMFVELVLDGVVAASQYCFRLGSRLHWFLTARDESGLGGNWSLGRAGFVETVRWAIANGCTSIDGLRGFYDYKLKAGGSLVSLQAITVVRRRRRSRLAFALFGAAARALDAAYYGAWFRRAAPRLGLMRPLWKTWIRSRL